MFILNPDPYLLPGYLISPFLAKDIAINAQLPDTAMAQAYLQQRFANLFTYWLNDGRQAIHEALMQCQLKKDDVVTIFTTSGNYYISSCVTHEIEKFCKWSREIEPATKVLFVNHEFGYPFPHLKELKQYNLPIIEDCAHGFFLEENGVGTIGDFVIYSLPKMFPIQVGGLLVSKQDISGAAAKTPAFNKLRYMQNVVGHYVQQREQIIQKRRANYRYLANKLCDTVLTERFELLPNIAPGVFMCRVLNAAIDLNPLKAYLYAHGIQSSLFYGESAFFIPVHQALEPGDLDYFAYIIQQFFSSVGVANSQVKN
jgi:hypothetical protein